MSAPRLSYLGQALPEPWHRPVLARARRLDPLGLLADAFVTYPPDADGLHPPSAKRWYYLLEQTICRYFRMQVIGAEAIPSGRALIIGCHSGVLPWDAACLLVALYRSTGRVSRAVGDHFFSRLGVLERFLATRGAVIGEPHRLESLLHRDEHVLLFPGGAEDMTRPIWERYRVKAHRGFARGRGGYIKVALRTQSPIVPVAVVGAEEAHMLVANLTGLARLLRLPFFPIVLSPFPLPARMYIRFGEPFHFDAPPEAAADQATVERLNAQVRAVLQELIDDTRRRRRGIYCSWYDNGRP